MIALLLLIITIASIALIVFLRDINFAALVGLSLLLGMATSTIYLLYIL